MEEVVIIIIFMINDCSKAISGDLNGTNILSQLWKDKLVELGKSDCMPMCCIYNLGSQTENTINRV